MYTKTETWIDLFYRLDRYLRPDEVEQWERIFDLASEGAFDELKPQAASYSPQPQQGAVSKLYKTEKE